LEVTNFGIDPSFHAQFDLFSYNSSFIMWMSIVQTYLWLQQRVERNNNNLDLHNNSCPDDMLVVLYFMVMNILCGFIQTSSRISCQWMVDFKKLGVPCCSARQQLQQIVIGGWCNGGHRC
jgi:hypothetical protein